MTTAVVETERTPVLRTLIGLLMALLVALLASSIVSTSLPSIVRDVGGSQATFTWAVTGTLLAITVSTPLWGKLSDLLNRKLLIQVALAIFIVGACLVGAAPVEGVLISGRVLQGIGAGGLMALVQIVMADIISPRERGKYMGLFGAVMTLGTAGGPLVGGLVTDAVGWRWNFYGSVPIALAALVIIQLTLHLPTTTRKARIDVAGAVVISGAVSLLLIWITLAGESFPWLSAPSLLLAGGTLVLIAAAIFVERRAAEPIIPPALFQNRTFVLTVVASLSVGVAVYGTSVFVSQYLQLSRSASPTEAGLLVLPQLIAVVISSTVIGALVSRSGRWKPWMITGSALLAVGLGGLATIDATTAMPLLWLYQAAVGLGIGIVMQNLVLVAENAADVSHMGVTSAGVAFFRTLGGTIGVTVLGALLSARSSAVFEESSAALRGAGVATPDVDLAALPDPATLPDAVRTAVEAAYASGAASVFLASVPLALLSLLAIIALPNLPLNTKTRAQRIAEREASTAVDAAGGDGTTLDEERP